MADEHEMTRDVAHLAPVADPHARLTEIVEKMKIDNEPVTVYIVLESAGGRDAVDGVHLDEAAAAKRRDDLNMRNDDPDFACVVAKDVRTPSGYLTKGSAAQDVATC